VTITSGHDFAAFERLQAAAALIRAQRARYPLALARLWHRDPPRTSQRTAFTVDIAELLHAVLGGMGSGKTEGAIQVAAAMARGRNDPEVRAWAATNGFPLARIPPDPELIIISSPSHQLSATVLRPLLAKYLPPGTAMTYWTSPKDEAGARLPNGCKIRLMAGNQPLDQWQSMKAQFALLDEQHKYDRVDSVLQRVTRATWPGSTGWSLFSATPAQAMTDPDMAWMHERLEVQRLDGYRMVHIYGSDNPYLDRAARDRLLVGQDAARRAMEDRGTWYNPGGMVFERYDRRIHVAPATAIPHDWHRAGALDLGTAAPTAYLASAYDAGNDVLHVYAGYYDRNADPTVHARAIHAVHARHHEQRPDLILGDLQTPDAQEMSVKYADQGVHLAPADKAFSSGVGSVNDRLAVRPRGRFGYVGPGLVIHDTPDLQPLIGEIPTFSWKKNHVQMYGATSKSTQGADHACDALRYLCHYLWAATRR